MVRPIEKSRVNFLRQQMLEYDKFSKTYEELVCTAPLNGLLGLVRSEMYMMHEKYSKGRKDKGFLDRYFKIRGVHGLALSLALDAKLIDNTHKRFAYDLHGFAKWGSKGPFSPTTP